METCRYLFAGDSALAIEFSKEIRPDINRKICALKTRLDRAGVYGITETVPTYCSLLVHYDPTKIQFAQLERRLKDLQEDLEDISLPAARVVEIPVCYGGELGPDLVHVAQYHKMAVEEVICRHTAEDYLVYMLGFIAGFPYLGGMDEQLATPRLITPRIRIESGSVGIAGKQTGVYPVAAPGGWQLIGRTPVKLYDPTQQQITLLRAGYYVRFRSITFGEYEEIRQQVAKDCYKCKTWLKEA